MPNLSTKKPTLEELREKLDKLQQRLQDCKQKQSNLHDDQFVRNMNERDKKKSRWELEVNLGVLKNAIRLVEQEIDEAEDLPFFQKLMTKLPLSKRNRYQLLSQ
jgi:chromosome segregation ATPase